MDHEYKVTGMSCGHCEAAVRAVLGRLAGTDRVEVEAGTGRLMVSSAPGADVEAFVAAVPEAGYRAEPVR
jgi:copper chaperone CopZ